MTKRKKKKTVKNDGSHWTKSQLLLVKNLKEAGVSLREIGYKLGRTYEAIRAVSKNNNKGFYDPLLYPPKREGLKEFRVVEKVGKNEKPKRPEALPPEEAVRKAYRLVKMKYKG